MDFRTRIKELCQGQGITQKELAELCGLSTNYIGEIERSGRKTSLETVEKIAKGLNIDPSLLLIYRKK